MTLKIGLTGGIGSGKSTVAQLFGALGIAVADADEVNREITAAGSPALSEIALAFGAEVVNADGTLDRAKLRDVLEDPAQRRRLEAVLHPRIRATLTAWMNEQSAPYCVLAIPLLIEAGWQDMVDRVLVVDAPEEIRRSRLAQRPGWTPTQIEAVMAAQSSREARLAAADDVIVNDGDLPQLRAEVARLHEFYLSLAATR